MNISLTPELDDYVHDKVSSGEYQSASEVVREALRLHRERETDRRIVLEEVRKKVAEGLEQLNRGEVVDGKTAIRELREKNRKRRAGKR